MYSQIRRPRSWVIFKGWKDENVEVVGATSSGSFLISLALGWLYWDDGCDPSVVANQRQYFISFVAYDDRIAVMGKSQSRFD